MFRTSCVSQCSCMATLQAGMKLSIPAQDGTSTLDRIAGAAGVGPLAALKRAYDAGGRVRVVTRHGRGVRGQATGALSPPCWEVRGMKAPATSRHALRTSSPD